MTDYELKLLPPKIITKYRNNPEKSGLAYLKFGKYSEFNKYSNQEISQMHYGIYKENKFIITDGDLAVNLSDVNEVVCVLENVTCYKKTTLKDFLINQNYKIDNIRTFYVKDYLLITDKEVGGTNQHQISQLLTKISDGMVKRGTGNYRKLYRVKNDYQSLQKFKQGFFPKDLYHPIKICINGFFFNDDYRIDNFRVESRFIIE